jgi:hypothetical protein
MTGDLKPDILLLNNWFKCFRLSGILQIESGQQIRLNDPFKSIQLKWYKEQKKICFKELNMTTADLR